MDTKDQYKLNQQEEEEEPKIPVFTVLKNGAILKNIFIVNPENPNQEHEEILTVGRHPDCNIILTHPSVSRFHLQIVSNPSLQKLSVIDLSSVHGTWVSEKKIDPCVRAELKEGDSLRIGGSSRVYRLHWIPLSRAYDLESPYVSVSDMPMREDEIELEAYQDENSSMLENKSVVEVENLVIVEMKAQEVKCEDHLLVENKEIQSLDLVVEGMSSLFSDESLASIVKKAIPSAPPIPENPIYSLFDENDELAGSPPLKDVGEHNEISSPCNKPFGTDSDKVSFPDEAVSLDAEGSECQEDNRGEPSFVTEVLCEMVLPESSSRGAEIESNHNVDWNSSFSNDKEEKADLAADPLEETENQSLVRKEFEETKKSSLLVGEVFYETEYQQTEMENMTPEALYDVESLPLQGKLENSTEEQESNSLFDFISACSDDIPSASERIEETEDRIEDHEHRDISVEYSHCMTESVNSSLPVWEVVPEIADDKENETPQSLFAAEGVPQLETIGNSPRKSEKKPSFRSIWSRRGKAANFTPLRTGRKRVETLLVGADSEDEPHNQESTVDKLIPKELVSCLNADEEELFTPDKENFTPNTLLKKSLRKKGKPASVRTSKSRVEAILAAVDYQDEHHKKENTIDKSISKEILTCLNGEDEEIFTPDKENFTSNTLLLKSLKNKGMLEEVKHSISCVSSSSKVTSGPYVHPEEDVKASSNKENQTLGVLQERKLVKESTTENQERVEQELVVDKRKMERVPFQSLVVNTVGKSRSEMLCRSSATRSSSSLNYTQAVGKVTNPLSYNSVRDSKRGWTMVVDTTTLLNKESRKALQLLQGLKRTRLIIPMMVIRELDSLKRRGSLFRRKTEACLVLEWIEHCMTETTWWIHVQSSVEDGRLTAPTPPATPRSPFSQGSEGFCYGTTWSPFRTDIVSPTTEDHILECALLCRKMKSDGQLVLLSDDVTLKIKAMAEGLICETVQEFRESLMNPFSERFLWVDSSPRGQTWSILDDAVLREKYNRCPLKKSLKGESAKGLKLILLHNSHYGQRTLIS